MHRLGFSLSFLSILPSRCSIAVSKLLGHNPVAVLATLLLMSYTKVLKITIEVYFSADLNKTINVWLEDANVPYLKSKHLLLTVITTLVLIFLTLFLGNVFYKMKQWKIHQVMRCKNIENG